MVKSKLTPQEIYRQRKQREEWERTAYLPPGLINHGNTCFMNSVLQGLLATRLLADLVYFNPTRPELQTTTGPILSTRSPQLTNGHGFAGRYKLPYVTGMPIGDAFLETLDKAWVSQANRRKDVLSPRALLSAIGRKYDQYLDFAQQDAHEFLRILLDAMRMEEFDIIKVRQPPLPPKKRRRITITPENLRGESHSHVSQNGVSSTQKVPLKPSQQGHSFLPTSRPEQDDFPLMSFVDMIFGGRLTSILVCQKCKHVSQTYEDFNDISLSLKPEDYGNRKRDRFRKIVGRLTNFPSATFNNITVQGKEKPQAHGPSPLVLPNTMQMLRSASVPPTPSLEKQGSLPGSGLEGPPIDASRRRSLDLSVESLLQNGAVDAATDLATSDHTVEKTSEIGQVKAKEAEEDPEMISDGSQVMVNLSGVEDRHVEFIEPLRTKEEVQTDQDQGAAEKKLTEEAAWSKFGRRISLNLGLGRQKDKKERDRKARSMDRPPLNTNIKEAEKKETDLESVAGVTPKKNLLNEATNTETPQRPTLSSTLSSSSKRDQLQNSESAKVVNAKFPTIQRTRSPKPPKPSPSETEYLRKILADVSFPSNNPFALLRPPLLHDPTTGVAGEKEKIAGTAWLGLGARTFSGIEECLRLFTAVEILDGENMVGCRTCWKIQNGVFHSKKDDSDEEEEKEGGQGSDHVSDTLDDTLVVQAVIPGPTSPNSPIHIQASQSTPTVSYYAQGESRSLSSLPTSLSDANLNLLNSKAANGSDSPLSLSVVSERSEYSRASTSEVSSAQHGPGGLPIPIISTTAPVDPPSTSSSSTPTDSSSESQYSSASEGSRPSLPGSIEELNRRARYAHLSRGILNGPFSTDSLVIPPRGTHRKRLSEITTDEGSSDDESDTTESTSVSAGSRASKSPSVSTVETSSSPNKPSPQEQSEQKPKKPKPVLMRPAYKRYLIATPPPVLVIHLKRFQQTLRAPLMLSFSNGFKKLDDYVSFPEYLDLSPFLAPRKEDYGLGKRRKEKEAKKSIHLRDQRCMYRLYGVVVHIGNMLGGHYIAYTALPTEPPRHRTRSPPASADNADDEKHTNSDAQKAPTERQWAYISDTNVRLTTLEEVLNSKAYICMYERC